MYSYGSYGSPSPNSADAQGFSSPSSKSISSAISSPNVSTVSVIEATITCPIIQDIKGLIGPQLLQNLTVVEPPSPNSTESESSISKYMPLPANSDSEISNTPEFERVSERLKSNSPAAIPNSSVGIPDKSKA